MITAVNDGEAPGDTVRDAAVAASGQCVAVESGGGSASFDSAHNVPFAAAKSVSKTCNDYHCRTVSRMVRPRYTKKIEGKPTHVYVYAD